MSMDLLAAAISILSVMVVLDAIWLGGVARRYYRETLGRLIAFEVRWLPAFAFYLLHTAGLILFVLMPEAAAPGDGIWPLLVRGGCFGLFTYGTYDLTNMATIRGWPLRLTLLDMLWGMVVSSLSAAAGVAVMHLLGSA